MTSIAETLVSVNQVSRYYGNLLAVNNISFEMQRGEVLGLLGPNGAGKSTTMQMITGNLAPSNGQISINQFDILDQPKQAKLELGYLPETPPVYADFKVDEFLLYCAKLHRISKAYQHKAVETAKQRCVLEDVGQRLIGNLSKGYQQRVGIAQSIIHQPSVIILDEPTVGLDPIQIREIRQLIGELGKEHAIILSTHILPEVTSTCDRVLIISNGELVFTETTAGLQKRMFSSNLLVGFHNPPDTQTLLQFSGVSEVESLSQNKFRIHHEPDTDPAEDIVVTSIKENWRLFELTPEQLSLEEIFVDITCAENHETETDNVKTSDSKTNASETNEASI